MTFRSDCKDPSLSYCVSLVLVGREQHTGQKSRQPRKEDLGLRNAASEAWRTSDFVLTVKRAVGDATPRHQAHRWRMVGPRRCSGETGPRLSHEFLVVLTETQAVARSRRDPTDCRSPSPM